MDSKKPWQSKTLLVNGVLGVIAFAALFVPGASSMSAWMSSHAAEIGMGWSVLNIVLRAVTKDKIVLGD